MAAERQQVSFSRRFEKSFIYLRSPKSNLTFGLLDLRDVAKDSFISELSKSSIISFWFQNFHSRKKSKVSHKRIFFEFMLQTFNLSNRFRHAFSLFWRIILMIFLSSSDITVNIFQIFSSFQNLINYWRSLLNDQTLNMISVHFIALQSQFFDVSNI